MAMVAGNWPMETFGPMYVFGVIESGNRVGAMVVSTVLLACSLGGPDRAQPVLAAAGGPEMTAARRQEIALVRASPIRRRP